MVLPRRWVEPTIAWLNRCQRPAKDWENLNRKALAFLRLASIRLMLRKLCNLAWCFGQTLQTLRNASAKKGACLGTRSSKCFLKMIAYSWCVSAIIRYMPKRGKIPAIACNTAWQ